MIVWLRSAHRNVLVRNNMIYPGVVSSYGAHSGVSFTGNRENTDPSLVHPSNFDFRLLAGSQAIRAGLPLAEVNVDFAGVARPRGELYDVGAYQYTRITAPSAPTGIAVK